MKDIKVHKIKSFTGNQDGGNPAGVVICHREFTEKEMQSVAKEVGYSETAFIMDSEIADYKVRFFTPVEEVDLCGHATVAAFKVLYDEGKVNVGSYIQETKAGNLKVEVLEDGSIMMDQNNPVFYDEIQRGEIAQSLNIEVEEIRADIPIQIVSTGLKDIFIPVKNLEILNEIKPSYEEIKEVSKKYGVTGYHVFSLETEGNETAQCRNFAPLYDIPEEAATGTSNGALASYIHRYFREKYSHMKEISMNFKQGISMGSPSNILVELSIDEGEIIKVRVGGEAVKQI